LPLGFCRFAARSLHEIGRADQGRPDPAAPTALLQDPSDKGMTFAPSFFSLPPRSGCANIQRMSTALTARPLLHLFAAALMGLSSMAGGTETPATAASAPPSAGLLARVTTLIGDAECDNQSQCHVVGVGAKACGGPSGFLAWSEKNTDSGALRSAVEAQSRAQAEENKTSGLASDCMVTPMPAAACRPRALDGKRVCQLGLGGASSAI
jgi:hypothetical protein